MYGDARHVVTTPLDFSCVQANADINAQLTESVSICNPALRGPCRTIEGGEDSIAHSLDQVPAELCQLSINRPIMLFEAGRPSPIADSSCLLGRAHDVREEHRGQKTISGDNLPRPGQELLDLTGNVRRGLPRDVVSRFEFHVNADRQCARRDSGRCQPGRTGCRDRWSTRVGTRRPSRMGRRSVSEARHTARAVAGLAPR